MRQTEIRRWKKEVKRERETIRSSTGKGGKKMFYTGKDTRKEKKG
jgi:hypothetical protein